MGRNAICVLKSVLPIAKHTPKDSAVEGHFRRPGPFMRQCRVDMMLYFHIYSSVCHSVQEVKGDLQNGNQFFGEGGGRTVRLIRAHHPHGNQTGTVEGDANRKARAHHPYGLRVLLEQQNRQERGRCQVSTERLMTLMEVADLLRVSPHTIRAWVRKDRLRPVRICRRLLFSPDELTRFLADSK